MNNQIIFWMNEFFEWIFLILFWMNKFFEWIFSPYNWMNYWMNQKTALFIRKMNEKCLFWTERAPFACFSLFSQAVICFPIWMNNFIEWIFLTQFEWIILLNEYSRFNFELNIELNHFLARFNVKMNNQNLSATPSDGRTSGPNYRTPGLPGSDISLLDLQPTVLWMSGRIPPRALWRLLLVVPLPALALVSFGAWRHTSQHCCTPGTN